MNAGPTPSVRTSTSGRFSSKGKQASAGILALLGILTAFDSMSIDMYLPAFSAIRENLQLASGTMEMSLAVFLIGLAVGQAISGPLADGLGRKKPLLAGVVLFGLASALVAVAPNGTLFLTGRFVQGLGGAAGLVIPRAIVSDIYDASQSTKIFSLLVQIQSVSPIIAPPLGGLLLAWGGWRSIFWILVAFSALTLIASALSIPETRHETNAAPLSIKGVAKSYWTLFRNWRYLGNTVASGLIMGTLFGYISASSFVFMTHFGLTPTAYSIVFAVNSIGMILVGQLNFVLVKKVSARRHLALGFFIHLFFVLALLAAVLLGWGNLEAVLVLLFLAMSSMSLIFGGITAAAIYSVPNEQAGTASALLGVMQYAMGGLAGVVLGIIHNETLLPVAAVLFAFSLLATICWLVTDRRQEVGTF